MNQSEPTTVGIDETIGQMDRLYRALTGADAASGDAPYAPIPAEKDPVQHVEEQLSRLLDLLGPGRPGSGAAAAWTPPLSVWESEGEILICVDVPGLKREQVEVVVEGNTITVSGTRPVREGARLRVSEAPIGPFRRTLLIPGALRGIAEPTAQIKDGVLEVRVQKPAKEATTARPVPVH
jgi:HSP20 family protein